MRKLLVAALGFLSAALVRADSLIASYHNQTVMVWLAAFDGQGNDRKLEVVGSGTKVVVASRVIARFRGSLAKNQFPAVGLIVECTPAVKLSNGATEAGTKPCQIEDGYVASYRLDPKDGTLSMTYRFGIYP